MEKGGFEKSSPADAYADLFCYLPTTSIHRRLTASTLVKTLIIKRHRNFYLLHQSLPRTGVKHLGLNISFDEGVTNYAVENCPSLFDQNTNTDTLNNRLTVRKVKMRNLRMISSENILGNFNLSI